MQTRRIIGGIILFFVKAAVIILIVAALYGFGEYAYDFGHQIYSGKGISDPPGKDVAVVISEGATVMETADMLERLGLIEEQRVFIVQERLSKYHGQMKAGNYVLNTSQSGEEILAVLSGNEEDLESGEET